MKLIYLLKFALIAVVILASGHLYGQMVGNNVFLKGHYVEVGIGGLGYYGSDSASPAGYHRHCASCGDSSNLGFVADPGMTGWSTGTPHFWGDYFLPGLPAEGWELQVNGKRCAAINMGLGSVFAYDGGMTACTGANISYTTSGSSVIGTWQGSVDSITLTQVTTIDTNDMFFTVKVTLTNTSAFPKNNIYYMRSQDPDNEQTWTGSFITVNVIEKQQPDTFNASVVSATGPSDPASYMALGSADTASRVMYFNTLTLPTTTDLSTVYGETYSGGTYTAGSTMTADIGIALTISIPHLAAIDSAGDSVLRTTAGTLHPANSASFTYFYSFSTGATDSAIARSTATVTAPGTLGIQNVNNAATINVYPNPAKNAINITNLNTTDQLSVYDMMGREMAQNWTITQPGTNGFSINPLPVGAYIIVVADASGNVRSRIPIQKQ